MYQLALYVGAAGQEYVVIIDTEGGEEQPEEFERRHFTLREIVDIDADLIAFPIGEELRKV